MTLPRFHVPEAAPGARVSFPEPAAHHAREVLRLRAGDTVRVFDGAGQEWEALLDSVTRRGVQAHVGASVLPRPESPLAVSLAMAALRGDRMELVVQKATELGVAAIRPLVTARTDSAARPALHGTRQERWERVASGAAEQSGRATVPRLLPTTTLAAFLAEAVPGRRLIFLEAPGVASLCRDPRPSEATLLIGPPGGFDPREVEQACAAGFEPVGLGPRVLRSETAAIAALTVSQVLWGDLA